MDIVETLLTKGPRESSEPSGAAHENIFVGVAWPYVNGDIHIGHLAGYLIPADVVARYHRMKGNDVMMVSGSDCYGTPVTLEADRQHVPPSEIADKYHERNRALFQMLDLSFDVYTKTTTALHHEVVQQFFLAYLERGLIYKGASSQYYSEAQGRFLPDRYVEGTCPSCGNTDSRSDQCDSCGKLLLEGELISPRSKVTGDPVEIRESEHYFFDWPQLQPFLQQYFTDNEQGWRPWVRAETEKWLKEGIRPRAITRDIDWGVEIPTDRIPDEMRLKDVERKRFYVWFEAVIGYVSASLEGSLALGIDPRKFWKDPKSTHYYFMGKDNLLFHTLLLPGQLHAADEELHLPDVPAVNQFLLFGDGKFSKSRGNSISSASVVEKYGLDQIRFYMALIAPESKDSSFTIEEFAHGVNTFLVGKIGNFINRSLSLARSLETIPPLNLEPEIARDIETTLAGVSRSLDAGGIRDLAEQLVRLSDRANGYISVEQPWVLKKTDPERFAHVMTNCFAYIAAMGTLMKPLMPAATNRLQQMTGVKFDRWLTDAADIANIASSFKLSDPIPLFKPVELPPVEEASLPQPPHPQS